MDFLEGREAVQNLGRGGRVDARAVEDAGRLQDVRGATGPRGEPRRRDEEVEDVGPRGEAGGADLCDDGVALFLGDGVAIARNRVS